MSITLPERPRTRESLGMTPLEARITLAGMPKVGKSTLLAGWAPQTTLLIDTHRGTTFLDGEHYVQDVSDWEQFVEVVDLLVAGGHQYKTVGIDLIDDIWTFADKHFAGKNGVLASATDDYQRSIRTAEGMFRDVVGRLFASDLGLWFVSHTKEVRLNDDTTQYVPKLDNRVRGYVEGACQFILLAEALGKRRVIHTQPSRQFQAGSRCPMPPTVELDAHALYEAMNTGLKTSQTTSTNGAAK